MHLPFPSEELPFEESLDNTQCGADRRETAFGSAHNGQLTLKQQRFNAG